MASKPLKTLRDGYGLNAFAFAAVLGVHVSTVYRWECLDKPRIELLQRNIIERMKRVRPELRADIGRAVLDRLLDRDELSALAELLYLINAKVNEE